MPFDLNELMNNPNFQFGMGMLGNSSPRNQPLVSAYNTLQASKKAQFEAIQEIQKIQLQQEEIAQKKEHTKLYGQQVEQQTRNNDRQQALMENVQKLFPQLLGQMQPQSGQPAAPMQPQQMGTQGQPPTQPTPIPTTFPWADKFVSNAEGGYVPNDGGKGPTNFGINQRANPDVNVKNLTADQASQIRQQRYWSAIGGDKLPPNTAAVAYDAAVNQGQDYAKQLLEKTGGDPALMIYQRRMDYRNLAKSNPLYAQELKGWESRLNQLQDHIKTQPPEPTPAAPQGMAPHQQIGMMGGLMKIASGDVGGMGDLATAMKPDYQAGTLDVARTNARTNQGQLDVAREKAAIEASTAARVTEEAAQKKRATQATDFGQVSGVLDASSQLTQAATALRNNPGLDHITGRYSGLPDAVRKMVDPQGMNAQADLDAMGSKVLLTTITALKALSQNGSTGFGQLSNVEGSHLINSVASLKAAQTTDQLKERLTTVAKATNSVMDRAVEVYEQTHDTSPYQGLPKGTRPLRDNATGEPKMSKNKLPLLKLPDGKIVEVQP